MNSLQETIRAAVAETSKPQTPAPTETKETTVAETKSGETAPEYVGGIDISDVPEQDRPRFREKLLEKTKLIDKGVQEKFKEISKYKSERDSLLAAGLTEDEAVGVLKNHLESKRNPQTTTQAKTEAVKSLDRMIKDAPLEQREALSNLRTIVKEESNADTVQSLLDKVERLERAIGYFNQTATESREVEVNKQLDSLTEKFGSTFIEKNRAEVLKLAIQYPKADIRRVLKDVSDPDDYEQAILARPKGKKEATTEKLNAITSNGSSPSGSVEHIDVSKTKYKDLFRAILPK